MGKREFYIGFLSPMPGRLRAFYIMLVPVLAAVAVGAAFTFAKDTKPMGQGAWDLNEQVSVTGRVTSDPYPMVVVASDPDRPILLVRTGKTHVREIVAEFEGAVVTLTGHMIARGPWRMLEINDTSDVSAASASAPPLPPVSMSQTIELTGEIVDSKCMLGVMKPGIGEVHKDCARMCILGGMPPMMLVRNSEGDHAAWVIVDGQGKSANKQVLADVAVPISLTGTQGFIGSMPIIKVDFEKADALRRL